MSNYIDYKNYFNLFNIKFSINFIKDSLKYKLEIYEKGIYIKGLFFEPSIDIVSILYMQHKILTESRFKIWLELYDGF